MDSMRSLNSSLPTSTPLSSKPQPPEQLLQAFKSAALSVTNLYKSAVADQADGRQQGYQDALEDLLVFLDKQNLGLMDGEGWKVRQWATERYSRGNTTASISDSEEDAVEEEARRSSSPVRPQNQPLQSQSRNASPIRKEPPPAQAISAPASHDQLNNNTPMFTFTAAPSTTTNDTDMSSSEQIADDSQPSVPSDAATPSRLSDTAVRLEVVGRGPRTPHRRGGHSTRSGNREVHLNAGTKRKIQLPDFFDLSNLGNGRDAFGGGSKRGKFA